jgi:hypothetical protein
MRLAIVVGVAAGLVAGGCGPTVAPVAAATKPAHTKPAPAKPAANAPCADRFSQSDCRERSGCRWIVAHKRVDGTYATAYCSGGRSR